MQHHSGGDVHTCATIQSCWDGDRLDLGRVGIKPHKDYLSEEGAKLIARAYEMSRGLPAGKTFAVSELGQDYFMDLLLQAIFTTLST